MRRPMRREEKRTPKTQARMIGRGLQERRREDKGGSGDRGKPRSCSGRQTHEGFSFLSLPPERLEPLDKLLLATTETTEATATVTEASKPETAED
jgi:hypothetical protein